MPLEVGDAPIDIDVPVWNFNFQVLQSKLDIDSTAVGTAPGSDAVSVLVGTASSIGAEPAALRLRVNPKGLAPGDASIPVTVRTSDENVPGERTAELHKLNQELDAFAYSVSHDLKSPLRAIDGFTQILGESLKDRIRPDEEQMLARVLAATRRMSTLIADMLALARVSQGPLQREWVDLSGLCSEVARQLSAQHPQRQIRFQIEPQLRASCDHRLVRIVLENLLGNAVKYTRDRAVAEITVGLVRPAVDTAHAPAWFFVRDNGIGFDMAYADKLFKPFQRLHMPSFGFEGTGIGLATVHRIIERHGGDISGSGQPDHGAEFRFSLEPKPSTPTQKEISHDA